MASSNPFRKSTAGGHNLQPATTLAADRFPSIEPISVDTSNTPPPPATTFRVADPDPEPAPSPTPLAPSNKKPKVVKKVRVLSPPPLSPDSPEWPFNAPSAAAPDSFAGTPAYDVHSGNSSLPGEQNHAPPAWGGDMAQLQLQQPPLRENPFGPTSQASQDAENEKKDPVLEKQEKEEGEVLKAANRARGSLNVESFQRLLMTGNAEDLDLPAAAAAVAPSPPVPNNEDTPVTTSSSEVSDDAEDDSRERSYRRLIPNDQRTSQPTAEPELEDGSMSDSSAAVHMGKPKKTPPPPPSSRHGKPIKADAREPSSLSHERSKPSMSHDVNKPLPPAPSSGEASNDMESPFDREAAGKVPEGELQSTPQGGTSGAGGGGKKAVPAPPPRRGRRPESKIYAGSNLSSSQIPPPPKLSDAESPSRASFDSLPAQVEGSRATASASAPAPAPPPPRRPHAAKRRGSLVPSPTTASFANSLHASEADRSTASSTSLPPPHTASDTLTSPHDVDASNAPKTSAPPPPPPARHSSSRKPSSINSVEAPSRRIPSDGRQRDSMAPPPPPPPRQRASSKGSMDGGGRRTSSDSKTGGTLATESPAFGSSAEPGKGVDILADLDALQREVDALRGKIH